MTSNNSAFSGIRTSVHPRFPGLTHYPPVGRLKSQDIWSKRASLITVGGTLCAILLSTVRSPDGFRAMRLLVVWEKRRIREGSGTVLNVVAIICIIDSALV